MVSHRLYIKLVNLGISRGADFSPDKVTLVEPALNLVANGLVIACVRTWHPCTTQLQAASMRPRSYKNSSPKFIIILGF